MSTDEGTMSLMFTSAYHNGQLFPVYDKSAHASIAELQTFSGDVKLSAAALSAAIDTKLDAGSYLSANALNELSGYWNEVSAVSAISGYGYSAWSATSAYDLSNFISGSYLSANALDDVSATWNEVSSISGYGYSAWSATSAIDFSEYVTSSNILPNAMYVLSAAGDGSTEWAAFAPGESNYGVSSLTPKYFTADIRETDTGEKVYAFSASQISVSGTSGVSAKYDETENRYVVFLEKEEIAYARYTTNSVVATDEATDVTITSLQEAEHYGDKITTNTDSITLQPGLYHADVKLMLQVTTPAPNYEAVKLAASFSPARSTEIDLDCSYVHNESICLSFDAMVSEESVIELSIENLPAGVGYTLSYFNIHEIVNVAGLLTSSQTDIVAGDGLSKDGNELAVKLGGGLKFDNNKNITIAVGNGLKISQSELTTDLELVLDDIAEETVKEVQQISNDLDEKVTTTYAQANITEAADMTSQGYSTDGNGVLFGYVFSVPIKNTIYIAGDVDEDGKPVEKVTVVGLYCKQTIPDASSVIVGLYEYDPSVERTIDGKTTYGRTVALCDTGPITILAGYHEYPMKNFNTDNPEIYRPEKALKSSNMYYASMYISKGVVGGRQLQIASCPGYNTEFHANPQLSVTQEGIGIDIRQEEHRDTSFNDFGFSWKKNADGTYSTNAYNERSDIHRPFMLFRNKKI